jgi:hypothetical protein
MEEVVVEKVVYVGASVKGDITRQGNKIMVMVVLPVYLA